MVKRSNPSVSVMVPGKIMLNGEYTVLHGDTALAVTIDQHLTVRARPSQSGTRVASNLWNAPRTLAPSDLEHVLRSNDEPLLQAVATGLHLFQMDACEVRVDSELEVEHGVGSSSALRLGVLLAIEELARFRHGAPAQRPRDELWPTARAAHALQLDAQAQASGYDVATQLVGGLVRFTPPKFEAGPEAWPGSVSRLPEKALSRLSQFTHIFVGGAGAPTTAILASTKAWLNEVEARMTRLKDAAVALHAAFEDALLNGVDGGDAGATLPRLVRAVARHRTALAEAPRFPHALAQRLADIPGLDVDWSYKTTGAGGEDALLLIGRTQDIQAAATALKAAGWHRLPAGFESRGARITVTAGKERP